MLALSTDSPLPPWMDPLTRALDRLWARGVTVVVASGNDGAKEVNSPATDPVLLVVGRRTKPTPPCSTMTPSRTSLVVRTGVRAEASRPGRPGVSLISTSSKTSAAYLDNPTSQVGEGFPEGSGTSMSAAVTAGSLAVLLSEQPELTPDQAKRLVIGTANRTKELRTKTGAGSGALDLAAALPPLSAVPPLPQEESTPSNFGPAEADEALWAEFGQAWESGDLSAVAAAWSKMTPRPASGLPTPGPWPR